MMSSNPGSSVILLSSDDESDSISGLSDERPPSEDEDSPLEISLSSGSSQEDEEGSDIESDISDVSNKETNVNVETTLNVPNNIVKTSNGHEQTKKPKKKRKREKKPRKQRGERRNIRKIRDGDKLDAETVAAQREEEERKRRLAERLSSKPPETPHLKTLLTENSTSVTGSKDVVEVVSSDDDCIIIETDKEDADDEDDDPENSGIHVNDALNQRDGVGRVLANKDHPKSDADVFLAPQIAKAVKPHQIGGIRFLYDNVVESLDSFQTSQGFGCILAHSMGLGKTLQVIAFTDIFLRYTPAKRVLIIVPVNTLQNWINEYDMWLPAEEVVQGIPTDEVLPRRFNLNIINDTHKTIASRAKVIEKWMGSGGVLLMGYEMFLLLSSRKSKSAGRKKKTTGPELIDLDQEDRNTEMQGDMQQALLNPGADLIVCDEGHRIKNCLARTSKSLKEIRTRRRVVLTGYPLQNNLIEYWCMVDFVRPNFLGTKVEFSNMFERPISNGHCVDSTPKDVKLMRYRAHVLHSLLVGFVQRRNHKVLMNNLPPKEEWVLLVKMSEFQRRIYNMFMEDLKLDTSSCIGGTNPLKAYAVASKIWNHPDVMQKHLDKQVDLDLDLEVPSTSKKLKKSQSESVLGRQQNSPFNPFNSLERGTEISYEWVKSAFEEYTPGVAENSGKLVIFLKILEETLALGEKLLVFSQSLITLNLLEEFLSKLDVPLPWLTGEKWTKNKTYYRLDGSTSASEREKLINQYNDPENQNTCLFLISTRAGCLGINLVGANRVVMFDTSWNPCHDCQAVCRVYRYGQRKPCFIYRLVTDNTMERKIYDRQVTKQGMSDRVVDEIQVQNQFTKSENEQLLEYNDKDMPSMNPAGVEERCFDPVLVKLIKEHHEWITQSPFTHESLLIEQEDQKLSKMDKKLAKESYEKEKRFNVTFSRQSYASYYQNRTPQNPPVFRGPSLPPMSNSIPMKATPVPSSTSSEAGISSFRPDVSVQTIRTIKDMVAPEGTVIKAGEQVTVIKTFKGVYIKLNNGKIFAVRNNRQAEGIGMSQSQQLQQPQQQQPSQSNPLHNFLHSQTRPPAPNIVSRKRPSPQPLSEASDSLPLPALPTDLDADSIDQILGTTAGPAMPTNTPWDGCLYSQPMLSGYTQHHQLQEQRNYNNMMQPGSSSMPSFSTSSFQHPAFTGAGYSTYNSSPYSGSVIDISTDELDQPSYMPSLNGYPSTCQQQYNPPQQTTDIPNLGLLLHSDSPDPAAEFQFPSTVSGLDADLPDQRPNFTLGAPYEGHPG